MKILVIGGAGYIASHEANYDFIVYDNLSNSSKNSLKTAGEIDG
jgi:UDP-glucose 4-epimerase